MPLFYTERGILKGGGVFQGGKTTQGIVGGGEFSLLFFPSLGDVLPLFLWVLGGGVYEKKEERGGPALSSGIVGRKEKGEVTLREGKKREQKFLMLERKEKKEPLQKEKEKTSEVSGKEKEKDARLTTWGTQKKKGNDKRATNCDPEMGGGRGMGKLSEKGEKGRYTVLHRKEKIAQERGGPSKRGGIPPG